jgi:hypothetical protein
LNDAPSVWIASSAHESWRQGDWLTAPIDTRLPLLGLNFYRCSGTILLRRGRLSTIRVRSAEIVKERKNEHAETATQVIEAPKAQLKK